MTYTQVTLIDIYTSYIHWHIHRLHWLINTPVTYQLPYAPVTLIYTGTSYIGWTRHQWHWLTYIPPTLIDICTNYIDWHKKPVTLIDISTIYIDWHLQQLLKLQLHWLTYAPPKLIHQLHRLIFAQATLRIDRHMHQLQWLTRTK